MTVEQLIAVLDAFKSTAEYATVCHLNSFGGVKISLGSRKTINVVFETEEAARAIQNMPSSFTWKSESKTIEFDVKVVFHPPNSFQARAGDKAKGNGLNGTGTVGWNFILDGQVSCLSNWHVFCPFGNNSPIGNSILLGPSLNLEAKLIEFDRVEVIGQNQWDFARGQYLAPDLALAEMRICQSGNQFPYPTHFHPKSLPLDSASAYRKVGDRDPVCREGQLLFFGDVYVSYKDLGIKALFVNQLCFSRLSDPGDSGSIIVNTKTNHIVGLIFAGTNTETALPGTTLFSWANPLFLKPWVFRGTRVVGSVELPEFTSTSDHVGGKRILAKAFGDLPGGSTDREVPEQFHRLPWFAQITTINDLMSNSHPNDRRVGIAWVEGEWVGIGIVHAGFHKPVPSDSARWIGNLKTGIAYELNSNFS